MMMWSGYWNLGKIGRESGEYNINKWELLGSRLGLEATRRLRTDERKEILEWIDQCPNDLFSALTFQGGAEWRKTLNRDFKNNKDVLGIVARHSDEDLHKLMTNLAGHDLYSLDEAFSKNLSNEKPTCFICYTVKGFGLPLAGHKDNHSGIMNEEQ